LEHIKILTWIKNPNFSANFPSRLFRSKTVETADRNRSLYRMLYLITLCSCSLYIATIYALKAPEIKRLLRRIYIAVLQIRIYCNNDKNHVLWSARTLSIFFTLL